MGDRIAVMRGGALQQVDTPERVYQRPANQFVAGFIGSPAMNMVEARLEQANGDSRRLRRAPADGRRRASRATGRR